MEQQYVIGVANKFEALLDSEDPFDVLQNVEAEKRKKKALKVASANENKENKIRDPVDVKAKAPRKPAAKPNDRVLTAERNAKPENSVERVNNRRNRDERPPTNDRNGEFPRTGTFREGGKPESVPRGPRPDGPRGEKRDGPRPFRNEGDNRAPRGPRQEGDVRPFRNDRQQGGDGDPRPPRKERKEFIDPPDGEGRPDRRPGGSRGGRGGRPPGPGRNYDTRGKREFDRKSGSDRTGVKAVDKRDGAGPYNWDSNKDLEALANDLNVTNLSDELGDWDEPPKPLEGDNVVEIERKEGEAPPDESIPPVEEPKELTLDEYRAIRGKREKPRYDIRKAGEGEDLTQWKDMVEIKKKNDEEQDMDDDMEIPDYPQRVGRQRHVVGIDITFNDTFRGGRGRGRGAGASGGRGRGRDRDRDREPVQRRFPREERKDGTRQAAPKVDDEKDFPSLG